MSLYCKRLDETLTEINQPQPRFHPECLSGRASWTVCSEGKWLCRPFPGQTACCCRALWAASETELTSRVVSCQAF